MTAAAFELDPGDVLPNGAVIIPWPRLHPGPCTVVLRGRARRARIILAGTRSAVALLDPGTGEAA